MIKNGSCFEPASARDYQLLKNKKVEFYKYKLQSEKVKLKGVTQETVEVSIQEDLLNQGYPT